MARRGENIYKRKDGRYEGRYIKYYDLSGRAVYGYVYDRKYTAVKQRLAERKTEKGRTPVQASVKLCDWLDIWLKSQSNLKPTTKQIYKSYIANHLCPAIGNIPLKKLNTEILQAFIDNIELSASSVKTVFSILRSALSAAQDRGFITDIWSKIKVPKCEKAIVKVLTPKQQRQLENVLTGDGDIVILICLYTGLRIGELCALKWSDINLESAILTVNGTQARTENGVEILSPKSRTSKREIPVPPFLLNKLKLLPHNGDFVVSHNGKPYDVRTYRRYFKAALKRADLPDIKYHSLRHTFATRALEVGMDYKTLSEILGHSSVGITLDLYAHSLKEHKIQQMNKLNKLHK